jgi:hypothetical protein
MGADHNRLDALRRLAKDSAATPGEKATARRLAKPLANRQGTWSELAHGPQYGPARAIGGEVATPVDHFARSGAR